MRAVHRAPRQHRGEGRQWSGRGRCVQGTDPAKSTSAGHPYYATARLWDDGIIDPADARRCWAWAVGGLNAPLKTRGSACSDVVPDPHG